MGFSSAAPVTQTNGICKIIVQTKSPTKPTALWWEHLFSSLEDWTISHTESRCDARRFIDASKRLVVFRFRVPVENPDIGLQTCSCKSKMRIWRMFKALQAQRLRTQYSHLPCMAPRKGQPQTEPCDPIVNVEGVLMLLQLRKWNSNLRMWPEAKFQPLTMAARSSQALLKCCASRNKWNL